MQPINILFIISRWGKDSRSSLLHSPTRVNISESMLALILRSKGASLSRIQQRTSRIICLVFNQRNTSVDKIHCGKISLHAILNIHVINMQGGSHTLGNHQTATDSPSSFYKHFIYWFFYVYTAFVFRCRNVQSYFSSAYATFHRISVSVRILGKKEKKKRQQSVPLPCKIMKSEGLALNAWEKSINEGERYEQIRYIVTSDIYP